MKKTIIFITVIAVLAAGVFFYYKNLRGVWPAISPPSENIAEIIKQNQTPYPLKLPYGFSISIFAEDLPGARVMAIDGIGNIWVSQTGEGKITLLEVKDGIVQNKSEIFKNLKKPHGLAFDPQDSFLLYFAEEDKISRVRVYSNGNSSFAKASAGAAEKIADIPSGGGHFTRTLGFGPDNLLYVSIGSSCNVCHESDDRRAKIFSMKKDGGDFKEFASGLRNTVFFTWDFVDGKMWATEMGRDNIGDDLPPDEINIIENLSTSSGQNSIPNFGWPICYGKNIHDSDFDKNVYIRDPCADKIPSHIDLQAHSAPLGLAFVPEEGWLQDYWHNLFVAYHGSWNRSEPTGYKVVRIKLDSKGNYLGIEDFITGWLTKDGALGRPVDILVQPGGIMYITDDKAGVIYKVTYKE